MGSVIPGSLRRLYYLTLAPAMVASGFIYRHVLAPRAGTVRVHLGPGRENYIAGWYNVDANFLTARIDVWANLLRGIPFRSGTVDAFYSHHMVEHFPDATLPRHFGELFRCLKPGGVIRVGRDARKVTHSTLGN